ncbi:MAG TPA: bifunctional (p)ppGpp synthetase/guanosine-3',5'-bis(diphosphate) 3'-pyrophosphohydrolase, partial [Anaerolineae bacterium]|nr:bifunctional (p)ppGpp synthetase/guanosine-3',5'-bis(diphosphate) 3'-pyrophosphohydrolase [Anaerolineae bacterium]
KPLCSGDRVKIITFGKKDDEFAVGKPSRDWMNPSSGYAKSSRTINRVRAWFRKHERSQNIESGRVYVERELKRLKAVDVVTLDLLAEKFGDSVDDLLSKIGFGDIPLAQLDGAIALVARDQREKIKKSAESAEIELDEDGNAVEIETLALRSGQSRTSKGLTVMGMKGLHTQIARCCNPIPPEAIVGYVTRGRGVTIHFAECSQVLARKKTEPERVVEANWGDAINDSDYYQVPFRIKAYRSPNLLDKIASVLGGQNINLVKTKSSPMRNKAHVNIFLLAEIKNLDQANWIAQKLGELEMVYHVAR